MKFSETELKILKLCQNKPHSNKEIMIALGYKSVSGNVKKALSHLQELGAIGYTIPEKQIAKTNNIELLKRGKSS